MLYDKLGQRDVMVPFTMFADDGRQLAAADGDVQHPST